MHLASQTHSSMCWPAEQAIYGVLTMLIPDLMVWVCLILDTGGALLRVFQPFMLSQAASESVDFKLSPTSPLCASPPHTHAAHLSTHKTDRASLLHTPKPDIQFISWKTCGRAKGWRTFYLVSLLSMLYLGSFHPPADSRVYTPPVRNPRPSFPETRHLKGKSGWHVQQDSFANVHHCVAATLLERSAVFVKAGFIHHAVYAQWECSAGKSDIVSLWEDVLQWDNRTFMQENGLLSAQN